MAFLALHKTSNTFTLVLAALPATVVYYRVEGVDGYGNASNQIQYCTLLDPGNTPRDPTITDTVGPPDPETGAVTHTLTFGGGSICLASSTRKAWT